MRTGQTQRKKPSNSAFAPRSYQKEGIKFLAQEGSGLFLDPGLGKTAIGCQAILNRKSKALVISGLRIIYEVWPREVAKWQFNLNLTTLHGKDKDRNLAPGADLYLINYAGLPWFIEKLEQNKNLLKDLGIDTLIIDESTAFKNHRAKTRLRLLRKHLKKFKYRHIFTGTPVPKGYLDLWAQIYLLDMGESLGKYFTHYKIKYFYQADYMGFDWKLRPGAEEEIRESIDNLVIRFSRDEIKDLPPLVDNYLYVELPPAAQKMYRQMERDLTLQIQKKEVTAANAAVASGKCRQIASGSVYDEEKKTVHVHDAKLEALEELIDSLQGSPLLVLYEYKHEVEKLRAAIGKNTPYIGSGVKREDVSSIIDSWNQGEIPVLLAHAGTIAHGLNLQDSGYNLCWYSITWNLEHYQQAYQRLWRSGQKHKVINHHIVAKGTIDEVIIEVLKDREATQTSLLKALERKLT